MANPYRDSSTTMTPQEMTTSNEAAESSIWDNSIQDFGAEVIGALTGYTPSELQMMGSGEITVNELNEPVYAKTGEAANPSGKANPMGIGEFGAGMINTTAFKIEEKALKFVKNKLGDGSQGYTNLYNSSAELKQSVVDHLFSSRKMDEALGITGNQVGDDAGYFGFTTKMKPLDFLKSASKRTEGLTNKAKRKDFAWTIAKDLADKSEMRMGPPKLWGDIQDGKIVIGGHEGRHRSDAIFELLGNDVDIPVDVQLRNNGKEMRRRAITNDVLDLPVVTEDGMGLGKTLRELLPEGFDTSALPKAN